MRALFSLVSLVIVVAIIMMVAKKQLQAVAPAVVPPASPGAPAPTVPEQSRAAQQKVLQDVNRALEQGASRAPD
ncbi:MAG TPA: hypothetical protein VI032_01775 [Burkholderiaceae bacterium]